MSSVRQVAAKAGVSPATVSRVFNNDPDVDGKTRESVVAAANALGYVPKVGPRATTLIGVALPDDLPPDLGSYYGSVVAGVVRASRESGYDALIVEAGVAHAADEPLTQRFARRGMRGIVLPRRPDLGRIVERLRNERFPHVLVADRAEDGGSPWFDTASQRASEQAVTHLIELRHRRIAIATYTGGGTDAQDRLAGYTAAVTGHGMKVDPRLIMECGPAVEDGARLIDQAMSMSEPPTAFYVTTSMASLGAMRRLLDRGIRVPEDVSLVGFDDCNVRDYTFPKMTVVKQDTTGMSSRAARWLINSFGRSTAPAAERLDAVFEVNQSTTLCPGLPMRILPDGRIVLTD